MKNLMLAGLSVLLVSVSTTAATALKAETGKSTISIPNSNLVSKQTNSVLKSGTFQSGEHPTSGGVRIITEEGKRYLEFDANFKTDEGPDLFVILHRSPDVIGTTTAPAHSINEGDYLTLAPLQQVSGAQRYAIPEEVNLDDYQSTAIWCRQFNATFGAAALSEM